MFTKQQLVEFGNYLLKTYDVQVHSSDGKNTPIYQREVSHADFSNWAETQKDDGIKLPSQFQIGDSVWLTLWSAEIVTEVHAVHFYEGKVKYDLKVFGDNGEVTRIYNIDSVFVSKTSKTKTPH